MEEEFQFTARLQISFHAFCESNEDFEIKAVCSLAEICMSGPFKKRCFYWTNLYSSIWFPYQTNLSIHNANIPYIIHNVCWDGALINYILPKTFLRLIANKLKASKKRQDDEAIQASNGCWFRKGSQRAHYSVCPEAWTYVLCDMAAAETWLLLTFCWSILNDTGHVGRDNVTWFMIPFECHQQQREQAHPNSFHVTEGSVSTSHSICASCAFQLLIPCERHTWSHVNTTVYKYTCSIICSPILCIFT